MKKLLLLITVLLTAVTSSVFARGDDNPVVVLHTSFGDITVEVYDDKAPVTAENFLQYVKDDFYAGTIFHRVIPGFVIQGGGLTTEFEKADGLRPPIENESDNSLTNERGTLSMARTRAPDSATSQFFINLTDNPRLNYHNGQPGYAAFARVIDGMAVVEEIASIPTGRHGFRRNVPKKMVVIESAEIVSD